MRTATLLVVVFAASMASAVERGINVWYPGETVELRLAETNLEANATYEVRTLDWIDTIVNRRAYDTSSKGRLSYSLDDVGGRFGAYRVELVRTGETNGPIVKTAFAFLTSPDVKPVPWLGTGGHPPGRGHEDGKYLDMLSAAGIGVFRRDLCWHQTETEKGKYRIAPAEEVLFDQLERRGIAWQPLLTWKNDIYANPLDPDGFAAFCTWVAKHWKGRARHYEIFNEPQNTPWREVYPREGRDSNSNLIWVVKFAEFCRKASDAIHAADPQATVAVSGEDVDWLLCDMIRKGCAQRRDLISFHPYCHFQPRPEREYWFQDYGAFMRELAATNGGASRFCITEAGWSTFKGKMKYLEIAGCYPKASFEHQAIYLTRMYVLSHLTGLDYACSYCWKDEGLDPSYTEHNFGQLFYDSTPKPAFAATAYLARLLGQSKPIGELSSERDKYRLAAFDVGSGMRVVAAWCIEGECTAELPASAGVLNGAKDLFGNVIPIPFVGKRLRLTERPVYLFCSVPHRSIAVFADDKERVLFTQALKANGFGLERDKIRNVLERGNDYEGYVFVSGAQAALSPTEFREAIGLVRRHHPSASAFHFTAAGTVNGLRDECVELFVADKDLSCLPADDLVQTTDIVRRHVADVLLWRCGVDQRLAASGFAAKDRRQAAETAARDRRTARLHDAKFGVFNHFLYGGGSAAEFKARVERFDVKKVAAQLADCGAGFYFITLMQGHRWLCAPNATFDRICGTKPGEACAERDLPMALADELSKRGIDLYLYFTGDGPYKDAACGPKMGFASPRNRPITRSFVENWASVLGEFAMRYGEKVKGWWIDGCYRAEFNYDDDLLSIYDRAIKRANPAALTAYNDGVRDYYAKNFCNEDFTAGEFNDFYCVPKGRYVDGAQAFALVPIGGGRPGWKSSGLKRDKEYLATYVELVNRNGGVVCFDVHFSDDGTIDADQLDALRFVGSRVKTKGL